MEIGIFANKGNRHTFGLKTPFLRSSQGLPVVPSVLAFCDKCRRYPVVVESVESRYLRNQALPFEEERYMIGGGNVVNGDHLRKLDLTEHGNLRRRRFGERFLTAACNLRH